MIVFGLIHRFDNLPIHTKCYHASVTTTDELAREIESSMQSSQQGNTHDHLIDPFGLTPFHVLLSAANCRLDLLKVLLDAYPSNELGWKDVNGKTAIAYYCQRSHHLPEESRNLLRITLQGWLVGSLSSWNGLEAWKSEMSSRVNAVVTQNAVGQRLSLLQEASMALTGYERIEATTLLELSLCKREMKARNSSAHDTSRTR